MKRHELIQQIRKKQSFLCVGLDPDLEKLPRHLLKEEDPIFAFNRAIIDATLPYAVAYKPNLAFYEAHGLSGWQSLHKTVDYLQGKDVFTIADAKRGDIGNTSTMYARAFFEQMPFDSITVAPYMGADSVTPFLAFEGKWVILLAATSNAGFADFQAHAMQTGEPLYEQVIRTSSGWGTPDNLMYVVGATRPEQLVQIRKIIPDHFLLIPGVGAQGGDLEAVCKAGLNADIGLLINSSRGIIYASQGEDFAEAAAREARKMQEEMVAYLR